MSEKKECPTCGKKYKRLDMHFRNKPECRPGQEEKSEDTPEEPQEKPREEDRGSDNFLAVAILLPLILILLLKSRLLTFPQKTKENQPPEEAGGRWTRSPN